MIDKSFLTLCEAKVGIKFPEINTIGHISAPFYLTNKKSITMKFLVEIYLGNKR